MKTKLSKLQKQLIVLFLLALTLLHYSCNPSTNDEENKDYNTTVRFLQRDTPPEINKMRQLLDSLFDLANKTVQAIEYNEPVPPSYVEPLASIFSSYYGTTVNPNISNIDFNINWISLSNAIQLDNYKMSSDTFIAFYYLLNIENPSDKYFTYVISKAVHKNVNGRDTIESISTDVNGRYFMLSKTTASNYELINAAKFKSFVEAYIGQVKFLSKTTGLTYPVKNYIHPLISYHEASSFYQFYNENKDSASNPNMLMLKVKNIINDPDFNIINRNDGSSLNDFCQAPLSYFYEGSKLFLSDKPNGGKKYLFRGMNVGRMCPPECN